MLPSLGQLLVEGHAAEQVIDPIVEDAFGSRKTSAVMVGTLHEGGRVGGADRRAVDGWVGFDGATPRRGPSASGDVVERAAGEHRRGLDGGAAGDELVGVGDDHRPAGQVGDDLAVGRAAGAAADRAPPARRLPEARRTSSIGPVEQAAHHALDRGPGELLAGRRRSGGRSSTPVASGRFGRALAVEVRHEHQTARTGRARRARGRRARRASTPSSRATASVTLVALSVQTSGRKRPVASAKPATAPVGSAVGASLTA